MKFLLDTNIISELSRAKPHGAVLTWFVAQPSFSCNIPSVALYEIQAGIERTARQDPEKATLLSIATDRLAREILILPLDAEAARETARLIDGRSLDLLEDAMIAAIAKVNRLTIATRNTRDFALFGVPQVNPFLFRAP